MLEDNRVQNGVGISSLCFWRAKVELLAPLPEYVSCWQRESGCGPISDVIFRTMHKKAVTMVFS